MLQISSDFLCNIKLSVFKKDKNCSPPTSDDDDDDEDDDNDTDEWRHDESNDWRHYGWKEKSRF